MRKLPAGYKAQPVDQHALCSKDIRDHYNAMASIYKEFWGDHIHHGAFLTGDETPEQAQLNLIDYCIALLDLRPGSRVFDIGCGHGGTAIYLAQELGCKVLGITLSKKQQALACKNALAASVNALTVFKVADAELYSYPKTHWDVLWLMESSEHFHDKRLFFKNSAGSLVQGGKLLLAAWTGSMQTDCVREVARSFLCPTIATATEYSDFIESAGLHIVETRDMTGYVSRTWDICHERAQQARSLLKFLPNQVREFIEAIDIIREAYNSGGLTYTVITAVKQG